MKIGVRVVVGMVAASALAVSVLGAQTLKENNDALLATVQKVHGLSDEQIAAVKAIFAGSGYMGQGNPAITQHPMSEEQCRQRAADQAAEFALVGAEKICGGPFMAPLYDPATQEPEEAKVCIDQFEFPDIPCTFPVVWVRASEAAQICQAMGKRMCDAHEWEGSCAGALLSPDYRFDLSKGVDARTAVARLREIHNREDAAHRVWSYGPEYKTGICGTGSKKGPKCDGGGWSLCGSNTYPTGSFPACHSPLGVYDLNGNAAEHMNLPLDESQMASRGSTSLGVTEMKGSWFIFDTYKAHEDSCRWRAPYWHGGRVMAADSHHNYHLGFRCCKTLP